MSSQTGKESEDVDDYGLKGRRHEFDELGEVCRRVIEHFEKGQIIFMNNHSTRI